MILAKTVLREGTNLEFRGTITKGLYYHENSVVSGSSVITAYIMQKIFETFGGEGIVKKFG